MRRETALRSYNAVFLSAPRATVRPEDSRRQRRDLGIAAVQIRDAALQP
jgi:hypothetical protein